MTGNSASGHRWARALLVLGVAAYVTIFNSTYRDFVAPVFKYWGLGNTDIPSFNFWLSAGLSVVPSLWMPLKFSRPSIYLFYVQYFLMFIPAAFLSYQWIRPPLAEHDALMLVLVMFAGLTIIQATYFIPPTPFRTLRLTQDGFWTLFVLSSVVLLAYVTITLRGNFRIANFTEIYDVRAAMVEAITATGSRFGFYAQIWLDAVILPLLFAVGFWNRRWWVMIPVAAGYVFLFGLGGAKAAILSVVYLPLAYLLLTRPKQQIVFFVVFGLCGLLLSGYATEILLPHRQHLEYIAVLHFRLFVVPPGTLPQYLDFFQTHPHTYLSHVTGISALIHYPYVQDIPYTIGTYYYDFPVGANSGMWAADGLAGFGLWGILPISLLCAVVFWALDSASSRMDPTFVGLALTYTATVFGNVSLFTTLITGGLILFMVIMLLAPLDEFGGIKLPHLPLPGPAIPLADA